MKKAILLAAYGAGGVNGTRTLRMFEEAASRIFPNTPIRWAFTSMLMRNRLAKARKKTDSVKKALCRLGFERFDEVIVQSLHIIPGEEFHALQQEIKDAQRNGAPPSIKIGRPLLAKEKDIALTAKALTLCAPEKRKTNEAIIWGGHGTWHDGSKFYSLLEDAVKELDANTMLATLSGEHGLERLIPYLQAAGINKVWAMPLLSVIGKHAAEDIAGKGPDSWQSILTRHGMTCETVLKGAIEYAPLTEIWVQHLQEAADS